ncbi:snRNA-activating protein complex subunit 1-like isoform X2 [Corticium candelabrum]|uniref:snRNA-activating protein complex subunit 1-like isoform X2 n=1 Tax=Corticium candelabrum TaxID=121492 RepID=UPI002E2551B9|nr:snRNA-activating protein complex subunit 1-like isoform X2 [Corticium candelabrum]
MEQSEVWAIAEDCKCLLQKFVQEDTLRFAKFSEVWRKTNFGLLQHAKQAVTKQCLIVERMLHTFAEYLAPEYSHPVRVGAVYALFSVYKTQIRKNKMKIRLTESMWKALDSLCKEMHEGEHYDVEFVIRLLKSQQAFFYTATSLPLSLGSRIVYCDSTRLNHLAESRARDHDVISTVLDKSAFSAVKDINDRYTESKSLLAISHPQSAASCSIVNSRMPNEIEQFVEKHLESQLQAESGNSFGKSVVQETSHSTSTEVESGSKTSSLTNTGDQGLLDRRRAIRSRSFSSGVHVQKKSRKRRRILGDSSSGSKQRNRNADAETSK